MTDRQVQHAAEFVAAHAVLVLGAVVVAALASLAAILGIVRLLDRYLGALERGVRVAVRYLHGIEMFDWSVQRARGLVPMGYLALHLTFGLALTAAVSGFVVIAEDVVGGGELTAFDVAFARALQETTTPTWQRFFAAVSWFGEREVIAVVAAAVAVWLLVENDLVLAGGWIAAQAAGALLNLALKEVFERTRPEFADPALAASSWSFPSGHVMGTFIVCGLGCYVFARELRSWRAAAALIAASLTWCSLMAFSRLYLGVHFVSDVIAGVVAGAAWVAVCASAFEMIRRQRMVSRIPAARSI